jgi:hypothetical protein
MAGVAALGGMVPLHGPSRLGRVSKSTEFGLDFLTGDPPD